MRKQACLSIKVLDKSADCGSMLIMKTRKDKAVSDVVNDGNKMRDFIVVGGKQSGNSDSALIAVSSPNRKKGSYASSIGSVGLG